MIIFLFCMGLIKGKPGHHYLVCFVINLKGLITRDLSQGNKTLSEQRLRLGEE